MRIRSKALIAGLAAVGLVGSAVAAAPEASADPVGPTLTAGSPVTVYQWPAVGVKVSGLVVPGPFIAGVTARSVGPGKVEFSAPQSPETCATTIRGANIQVGYVNLATGHRGGTAFAACGYLDSLPTEATAHTGSGPVAITIGITGSGYMPNAGQPSLPGVGGFMAP